MTVKQLRDFLKQYPKDMEVITRCSDWQHIELEDVYLVRGVDRGPENGYLMQVYDTMEPEDVLNIKTYLVL